MPRNPNGELVEREFLTLPVWDRLDAHTAETVARAVEQCLPEPWKFHRIEWHECGDQKRHVAFFKWKKAKFALVPGGEVTLGYDPTKPFEPTAAQEESWQGTVAEYRMPPLAKYLRKYMTPLRRICLAPMLVEVRPVDANQLLTAEAEFLANKTFRLLTVDEWEYACGAGSRTLWRWGNETPEIGYPTQFARSRRFRAPRKPNAFGMLFPSNGYDAEGIRGARGLIARSGDGGGMTCGGAGFLAAWLLLATSFRTDVACDPDAWNVVRRVFPLPDSMLG